MIDHASRVGRRLTLAGRRHGDRAEGDQQRRDEQQHPTVRDAARIGWKSRVFHSRRRNDTRGRFQFAGLLTNRHDHTTLAIFKKSP